MKKYFYTMLITILVLSGLIIGAVTVFSEAPEPNCVCAECNQKCGTGHASTCSSNPKK
jgi:hypothetical protein